MAARQFSSHQEYYPARGGGTLGADRKAATALVFQDVVAGVASTVAIQGNDGSIIAIQASALNTDDVIFNVALTYVNALGGGLTYFEVGNYNTSDPIDFPGNNLSLVGTGRGSFINGDLLANNENAIEITGRNDCILRNFSVQTNDGGGLTIHCIFIENGSDRFRVESVWVVDSDEDGIHVEGTSIDEGIILECIILNADNIGINLVPDALNNFDNIIVSSNSTAGTTYGVDTSSGNIRYSQIINNSITGGTVDGIRLTNGSYCIVSGNIVTAHRFGILVVTSSYVEVDDNDCFLNVGHGIYFLDTDYSIMSNNVSDENDSGDTASFDGILVDGSSTENIIIGNYCYGNHRYGLNISGQRNDVVANKSVFNDREGIIHNCPDSTISSNHLFDNGQDAAGTYNELQINGVSDRVVIIGNEINSPGDSSEDCINLGDGAVNVIIIGNYCYNGMGSGIALTANNDNCSIIDNYCMNNDDYGIEITAATCNDNLVKHNYLTGNVTGPFLDNGTDTRLATVQMEFIQGTTFISTAGNPWGWEIDADTEFAIALGQLPLELQQVVRIKIWAVGLVDPGPGNYMRAQFTGEAAGSHEAYTTEPIDVVDKNNEEADLDVNDVIHWVLDSTDDADIGDLLGGDSIQFKVLHEGAGNSDIETDAIFRCIEIEYV